MVDCEETADLKLVRIFEAGSVLTAGFSAYLMVGVMVGFPHVYPEIDQSLHLIIASYGFFAPGPLPSSIRLCIGASTSGLRPGPGDPGGCLRRLEGPCRHQELVHGWCFP